MQTDNSIPSAGANDDSNSNVEDTSVSQHSSKPLVVGSQVASSVSTEEINKNSKSLNTAMPGFSNNALSVFKKYITPIRKFYFVKKQSVLSCGIKLTTLYFLGLPIYRSVFSSDED